MPNRTLTTTSHALLGLIAIRPWTTYELARQMERSFRRFWPRAESNLYGAAKSLVEHGLARAQTERVGRRRRVVYSITPKGRRVMAGWIAEPGSGPVVEFETLVKVFFAEHGTREDVLRHLASVEAWADAVEATGREIACGYLDGTGPFPERLPQITFALRYVSDHAAMTRRWARWAAAEVATWSDEPDEWNADLGAIQALADRE